MNHTCNLKFSRSHFKRNSEINFNSIFYWTQCTKYYHCNILQIVNYEWDILNSFFHTKSSKFRRQHISIRTSYIASALEPHEASGSQIGQHRYWKSLWWWNLAPVYPYPVPFPRGNLCFYCFGYSVVASIFCIHYVGLVLSAFRQHSPPNTLVWRSVLPGPPHDFWTKLSWIILELTLSRDYLVIFSPVTINPVLYAFFQR